MKRLAILGASGHGKVVADAADCLGWDTIDFFDDAWPQNGAIGAWTIEGDTETLLTQLAAYDGVVVAIGHNLTRMQKHAELASKGAPLVSIVHPAAMISRHASIGAGSVVMASAVVNVDTKLGEACIINTGATIDHDCQLGDGVHVSPGAHLAGGVVVDEYSWIGIGASVRQQIHIGTGVIVGAGAVVIHNVPDYCKVAGVPARVIGTRDNSKC
jgi:sugar O-acyltransferase (sialic acid O-acetyltransferase NeuD family)